MTDIGPRPGTGPAFLSAVLTDGTLFPLAAMAIVLPLFLPVAVAVLAGDAIAGEAQPGTLRYVLVRPVGRTRLLVAKLAQRHGVRAADRDRGRRDGVRRRDRCCSATAGPRPDRDVSPARRSRPSRSCRRTRPGAGYALLSMLGVAAVALFLSTVVESPLGCRARHDGVLVASTLLLTLDAADVAVALPADPLLAGVRRPVPRPDPVAQRRRAAPVLQLVYVVVLLGAGWANFTTKDIKD